MAVLIANNQTYTFMSLAYLYVYKKYIVTLYPSAVSMIVTETKKE